MTTRGRRSGRSRSSGGRPRRRTMWFNGFIDPATVAAGAQAFTDLMIQAPTGEGRIGRAGLTLIRTMGWLRVDSSDASLSAEWTAGIAVVDQDAALGSALPDPSSDATFPWVWWMRGVSLPAAGPTAWLNIDVKSMRRFRDNGAQLHFIMDNDDATQSLEYAFGLRLLYKLP